MADISLEDVKNENVDLVRHHYHNFDLPSNFDFYNLEKISAFSMHILINKRVLCFVQITLLNV